jgi:hypothetical protein
MDCWYHATPPPPKKKSHIHTIHLSVPKAVVHSKHRNFFHLCPFNRGLPLDLSDFVLNSAKVVHRRFYGPPAKMLFILVSHEKKLQIPKGETFIYII